MNSIKFKTIMIAANLAIPGIDEILYGKMVEGVLLFGIINFSMAIGIANVFLIDSNPWTFGWLLAAVHGVNAARVLAVWRVL
jgi:TM2 domain-containing membrane protein YozV